MKVKQARKLRNTLLITGFFIALSGCFWEPLGILGILMMFSCLIPHFLFNKCPRCKKQLGRNEGEFCQFCGAKLED